MMHWFSMFTEVKSRCMRLVRWGSKRAAREVPGVVAVLLAKCGRLGVMFLKRLVVYEATRAKTATSKKGSLPRAK